MRELTYDPYLARLGDIIRKYTAPTDKLVIVGGGWGGEESFRAHREGLSEKLQNGVSILYLIPTGS